MKKTYAFPLGAHADFSLLHLHVCALRNMVQPEETKILLIPQNTRKNFKSKKKKKRSRQQNG